GFSQLNVILPDSSMVTLVGFAASSRDCLPPSCLSTMPGSCAPSGFLFSSRATCAMLDRLQAVISNMETSKHIGFMSTFIQPHSSQDLGRFDRVFPLAKWSKTTFSLSG